MKIKLLEILVCETLVPRKFAQVQLIPTYVLLNGKFSDSARSKYVKLFQLRTIPSNSFNLSVRYSPIYVHTKLNMNRVFTVDPC